VGGKLDFPGKTAQEEKKRGPEDSQMNREGRAHSSDRQNKRTYPQILGKPARFCVCVVRRVSIFEEEKCLQFYNRHQKIDNCYLQLGSADKQKGKVSERKREKNGTRVT